MNLKDRDIQLKEPISNMDDKYKFPSCDLPRSYITFSDSSQNLVSLDEYKTSFSSKKVKKVKFNQNVTVINIQSYKNKKTQDNEKKPTIFDEDFNKDKIQKQCSNCSVF